MVRASFFLVTPLAIALCAAPAQAQSGKTPLTVKIGVLSDMSGLYADIGGQGSVIAARMAVEDFNAASHNMNVDIVSADHQNKPDIGAAIARRWYDVDHVNAVADVPNSGVALAVSNVTREKNGVFLISGAADSDLTGKQCSPNSVHWTYDTWALAHGTGGAIVNQGGKTWFFVTADYAFGHALERDTAAVVTAAGGKVLGAVRHPLNTADFSSYLLQAQSSKAQVIGLANAGGDTINAVKQAAEFGIVQSGQRLAGLLVFLTDVHALGLQTAQGLTLTTAFYWDLNDQTRAFAKRFAALNDGKYPTMVQAGVYSSVRHYLEAVAKVGSASDGAKVVEAMKGTHYDDPLFGDTVVRQACRARHVSGRGQEAVGIKGRLRLFQDPHQDSPREGVPSAGRRERHLQSGEDRIGRLSRPRHRRPISTMPEGNSAKARCSSCRSTLGRRGNVGRAADVPIGGVMR